MDDVLNKAPSYESEVGGIKQLEAILQRSEGIYYPDFYDKVAFLFLGIDRSHFFSNGNKRLAIIVSLIFAFDNGYRFAHHSKEMYAKKLKEFFPDYVPEETDRDFLPDDFFYYHLAIIVADSTVHNLSDEDLKTKVAELFRYSLKKAD